jgi:hypothetical protein
LGFGDVNFATRTLALSVVVDAAPLDAPFPLPQAVAATDSTTATEPKLFIGIHAYCSKQNRIRVMPLGSSERMRSGYRTAIEMMMIPTTTSPVHSARPRTKRH